MIHPPAEAQVDFGLTSAVKDGKYIDVHCLVMTLPYSNAAFCVALPGENQECFLYDLKMIFTQLGGVPRKIRIDNLKAAVVKPRGCSPMNSGGSLITMVLYHKHAILEEEMKKEM